MFIFQAANVFLTNREKEFDNIRFSQKPACIVMALEKAQIIEEEGLLFRAVTMEVIKRIHFFGSWLQKEKEKAKKNIPHKHVQFENEPPTVDKSWDMENKDIDLIARGTMAIKKKKKKQVALIWNPINMVYNAYCIISLWKGSQPEV